MKRQFAFMIILSVFLTSAYSADFYRGHFPFTLTLTPADTVIVNYDITEKNGIKCWSDSDKTIVNFTYKGRPKTSNLPVILQSAHVPEKNHEDLADVEGQFSLLNSDQSYKVNCDYV